MNDGFIKLYRKLLYNALWKDCNANQKVVMITILLMVNHKSNSWIFNGEEHEINEGECVTSLKSICELTGLNIQVVRTALLKLEKHHFLTSKSTNKNRWIKVENWEQYQGVINEVNKQTNKQLTSNQQATNKQLTTNKNVRMKECKNIDSKESLYVGQSDRQSVIDKWNELLPEHKIYKISSSSKRYKLLNARLSEYGLGKVFEVVEKTSQSDFLRGQNKSGWSADFEWIMRPNNFIKVLEDKYKNSIDTKMKEGSADKDLTHLITYR